VSLNTVEAYDPTTNTWATVASMPTPVSTSQPQRAQMVASTPSAGSKKAASDGRSYAIGGHPEARNLNPAEAYDPNTKQWSTMGKPPVRGQLAATTGRDGRIYVIGGGGTVPFLNTVEALSFSSSKP
jgi:hypothetical protein